MDSTWVSHRAGGLGSLGRLAFEETCRPGGVVCHGIGIGVGEKAGSTGRGVLVAADTAVVMAGLGIGVFTWGGGGRAGCRAGGVGLVGM